MTVVADVFSSMFSFRSFLRKQNMAFKFKDDKGKVTKYYAVLAIILLLFTLGKIVHQAVQDQTSRQTKNNPSVYENDYVIFNIMLF